MTIAFDQIPLVVNTPGVFAEFDASNAVKGSAVAPHEALIVGQMLSTGTATAGVPYAVASADEAKALGGEGSQAALMAAAFKAADPLTDLWMVFLADNGSGVAATGSIVWTGTATESKELPIYVAGRRVSVSVVSGDTASTVETKAVAAFALERDLPVTVAADAAAGIDFTARNKGTAGNQIFLGVCQLPNERVPAGLAVTVTAMSAGATDPVYSGIAAALGEEQYHTVVSGLCVATPTGLLVTEFESRWGAMRAIEGQIFAAYADTRANLTTLGNSFNSLTLTVVGVEASALERMPCEIAACVAGLSARQTQTDPSRALTGVLLPGFYGPKRGSRFTRAERDILISDGISTLTTGADGRSHIERLVTTYQTNSQSIPDKALQDLTTVRLLAALRYSAVVRIGSKFARFKLADDDTAVPPGQPIVTPKIVKGELIALFLDWQDNGWVEGLAQFKRELLVERDGSDPNRMNALLPPDLINNLLVTAMRIAFRR